MVKLIKKVMSLRGKEHLKRRTKQSLRLPRFPFGCSTTARKGKKSKWLSGMIICFLLPLGISALVGDVYSSIEPYLTEEEQSQLRAQRFEDLGHGPVPDEKMLKAPLDELMTSYNDSMACAVDTGLKDSMKNLESQVKDLRGSGGIKKIFEGLSLPESSPCTDTQKKELAKQARFGAQTAGLSEGKNGAPTQASDPGAVNQMVLTSQNRLTQLRETLKERNGTAALLNRGCEEGRFDCPKTTQASRGWLLPVAMAATISSRNQRELQTYAAEQVAAAQAAYAIAQTTEKRTGEELASHAQYQQLSQLIQLQMDKQQEINAKAEIMKQAVLKLEEKFDQGGVSHNTTSI